MSVTAILTSDMHIRNTVPRNRIDNYFLAQEKKIKFIKQLQLDHNIPILDAGDLFDKWDSSPFLEAWAIKNLPNDIYTIPGNHELPSHDVNNLERSSLHVLEVAEKICLLQKNSFSKNFLCKNGEYLFFFGFPWGSEPSNYPCAEGKMIALIHSMVIDTPLSYKDTSAVFGEALLDYMSNFDLIVTGHNHKSFVVEKDGRFLVNPGSMMRMSKSQINDEPRVYL